jgi:two-component system alkaline phosphatase synthesis response regulator PhoP
VNCWARRAVRQSGDGGTGGDVLFAARPQGAGIVFFAPLAGSIIGGSSSPRSFPPAATDDLMSRKSRILIADDNKPNVELLEAYLAGVNCDIQVALDGQDALERVAVFRPDLILLDIMMPKLSGFEVCRKVKSDPATRRIMILMVTALNELGDIERGVAAGTDDFLSKPVNKVELLKRVENMLRLKDVEDENERLRRYIQDMEDPPDDPDGGGDKPG